MFKPRATYLLIALHALCYVLQQLFESYYGPRSATILGALSLTYVVEYRQYWRVLSSVFLHADIYHFLSNMFGLYVLGPFVEMALGRVAFAVCYISYGIGASIFVLLLTYYHILDERFLLGASGAVLGLVGGTAVILIFLWKVKRDGGFLEQLRGVGVILVIQAVFDLSTPQVSFHAHLGGVISGVVVTAVAIALIRLLAKRRESSS